MTLNTKFLAGSLALVLVAGMTSPAFAGKDISCEITEGQMVDIQIALDEKVSVPKTFECSEGVVIGGFGIGLNECEQLGLSITTENAVADGNIATLDEVFTNTSLGDETAHCEVEWTVIIVEPFFEEIPVIQEIWLNESEQQVAGELLPTDSTALLIGGLSSITPFMVPAVAGIAGAAVYLVKYRSNKE